MHENGYTFEHYPHKVRIVFKGNVLRSNCPMGQSDKSIKTHRQGTSCANLHICTFKTPTSWAVMSEQGDADCAFEMRNGVNVHQCKSLPKYIGRLPTELVHVILSYSYCPQPQEHLDEIKDVWTSKRLLYNLYNRRFLHDYYDILYPKEEPRETLCLVFDLRTYFARHSYYFFRNPMLRTKKQVKRYVDCLRKKSANVQINIYLGIMTVDERAEFVDVYFSKKEVDAVLQLSTS